MSKWNSPTLAGLIAWNSSAIENCETRSLRLLIPAATLPVSSSLSLPVQPALHHRRASDSCLDFISMGGARAASSLAGSRDGVLWGGAALAAIATATAAAIAARRR
ncbi:MAG: hypothetical protein ACK8QZ_03170, partial [Anaerolineales bacterium]